MKKIKILMVMLTIMSIVLNSNVRLTYSTNLLPPTSTNPNWMTMDIGYGLKYDGPKIIHGRDGDIELFSIKVQDFFPGKGAVRPDYKIAYAVKASNVKSWHLGKPHVKFKICGYDSYGIFTYDGLGIVDADSLTLSKSSSFPQDTVKLVLEEWN